jgi:nitroreductase
MDVLEAIHNRHSIKKVKQDAVPRELIEKLLDAAVQAPNHYKVRPWRFVVLTGEARHRLADVMFASLAARHPELPQEAFNKAHATPFQAPVVIAVGVDKPSEPKVLEIENICAVAAATQNLLLSAHAFGLGAKWRTGDWARDPSVKAFLGFEADQNIIGFIYVGYPEFVEEYPPRPSFEDRTIWMQ